MITKDLFLQILNLMSIVSKKSPIISTTSGIIRGNIIEVNNYYIEEYLNIPYAEPPLVELRFAKPVAITNPIKGVRDGTRMGDMCFQLDPKLLSHLSVTQSEDCLVLNVWTKRNSHYLKPVMVFVHGGALEMGTAFRPFLNGTGLALFDVVAVTINYRLGPFGWLYSGEESAPGNVGLYDQLLALNWVKKNIQFFGGDPNQVTLFGQSAGGWSVSAIIMSTLSKGLFNRAILESGAWFQNKESPVLPKARALSQAKDLAKSVDCLSDNQWLECLRRVDPIIINSYKNLTAYPIYGTDILPLSPQNAFEAQIYSTGIDLMAGTVLNEGTIYGPLYYPKYSDLHSRQDFIDLVENIQFSRTLPFPNLNSEAIADFYLKDVETDSTEALKQAFLTFYGDLRVTCSTYFFTKQFAKYSPQRNVYFYYFTYASLEITSKLPCTKEQGVCHQSEVPYAFGEPLYKKIYDMTDQYLSELTIKFWTNFAKYGNPVQTYLDTDWPRIIKAGAADGVTKIKEINPFRPNHIIDNLFGNTCESFWKNYFI